MRKGNNLPVNTLPFRNMNEENITPPVQVTGIDGIPASIISPGQSFTYSGNSFVDELQPIEALPNTEILERYEGLVRADAAGITISSTSNPSRAVDRHYAQRQQDRERRSRDRDMMMVRDARTGDPTVRGPYRASLPIPPMRVTDNTTCVHCSRWYDRHDGRAHIKVRGSTICSDCARDYVKCPDCSNIVHKDDSFPTVGAVSICYECRFNRGNYIECTRCRLAARADDAEQHEDGFYCPNCYENMEFDDADSFDETEETEGVFREYYNRDKKFCGTEPGKIIKSPRIFSAEIECYFPTSEVIHEFSSDMPKQLGIGTDGSLAADRGIEIRTPILQGEKGEGLIKKVCERLNTDGFKTDKCCGLHIHLDGGNMIPESPGGGVTALKLLWVFYLTFEDVILSFLPKERRKNGYCRLLRPCFHAAEVWYAQSLDELEKIWYRSANRQQIAGMKRNRHHDTRYHGFNIHSLLSQNHLEVRFHSGTISESKILEWVNLHQTIMDIAEQGAFDYDRLIDCYNLTDFSEKTEEFFKMLKLPKRAKDYFISRAAKFADRSATENNLAS